MNKSIKHALVISVILFILSAAGLHSFNKNMLSYETWRDKFFEHWYSWPTFNFTIYYYRIEDAQDVINEIDDINNLVQEDLDFMFMFQAKKTKVYIYKNNMEYFRKTGSSPWAGGHSSFKEKAIYTFGQENINDNVIVHELTHMLVDSYINFPRKLAVSWLHEGLAVYEEYRYKKQKYGNVPIWNIKELKEDVRKNRHLPLRKALRSHMGYEQDSRNVSMWYLQMGTLIAFMMGKGQQGLYIFCESLKQYRNVDESLSKTYPWDFKNIDDLEKKWKQWILKQKDRM